MTLHTKSPASAQRALRFFAALAALLAGQHRLWLGSAHRHPDAA